MGGSSKILKAFEFVTLDELSFNEYHSYLLHFKALQNVE
jgi:hypothetical protein